MGCLVILSGLVVLGEGARFLLGDALTAKAVLAVGVAVSFAAWLNARGFVVRRFSVPGPVKRRLLVMSDLHLGPARGKEYLERVVEAITREAPDLVLIPGDLVDGPGELPADLLEPLDRLDVPVFYSYGNHEEYLRPGEVESLLKRTKVRLLRNGAARAKGVTVVGIDDSEDRGQVARALPGLAKGFTVLLYHRPDGLEDAAKHGADLMFSGHTHYGQVFPFTLLVRLRFPRIRGWFSHGGTRLYVSPGAGTWGPPMRLGSRNELVVVDVAP